MLNTMDIRDLQQLNTKANYHWFDADTLRFFRSRYARTATVVGRKAYFVSSEQFVNLARGQVDARRYSVRVCDLDSGKIDTVGEFQQYATGAEARAVIRATAIAS